MIFGSLLVKKILYKHFIPLKGLGIIFNYFKKYSDVLTCDGGGITKVTHGRSPI
jgi:hypothetical protein